jgi:FAD/FMN-containing dehydrogenase
MKEKHEILSQLKEAVGTENADADKEICFAYARDQFSPVMGDLVPDYVVRPGSREEVQKVVRLAAREGIPLQPMIHGTNCGGLALATSGGILVDMRRMNRILEVSEISMAAVIEPAVTWGQLEKEANKKGLYVDKPMGPSTGSPVGSWSSWNMSIYFGSAPADKVLSLEVVLPNGEILQTGSAAYPKHESMNPYFREAYGPDLTGLFRGAFGAFGIITKMGVGLHPLFEVQERVDIGFGELDSAVRTMQEIARINVQTFLQLNDNYLVAVCCAPDFLRLEKDREELKRILALFPRYLLSVGLNGTAEQVALYRKMAGEIASGKGGSIFDPSHLEPQVRENLDDFLPGAGTRVRRMFASLNTFFPILAWLPFDRVVSASREACELIQRMGYRSALSGESAPTLQIYLWGPHGRTALLEHDLNFDPQDGQSIQKVAEISQTAAELLRDKYGASCNIYFPGFSGPLNPEYERLLKGIKKYFDPHGIMSPGKLIAGE